MKKFVLLFCLAGAAFADSSFELDPPKTEIHYTLHDPLHTVHGTFKLRRGSIHFDPATGKAGGEIVIDVASGASGSDSRDKRMHKEILESKKYPEAVFKPSSVKGRLETEGESTLDLHGVFNIHGADHEMNLQLLVDAQSGGRYLATSHFEIPYVEWGIKDPSNFLIKVDKKVLMEVKAAATTAH
ncbi:MAG TPA: YceI family protein [Bryobacteraceae bacterium]|nr:YceI family protein [Bryobacteraceae bacterium]